MPVAPSPANLAKCKFPQSIPSKLTPALAGGARIERLCLSRTSKCLSSRELYFFHHSLPVLISIMTLFAALSSIFRPKVKKYCRYRDRCGLAPISSFLLSRGFSFYGSFGGSFGASFTSLTTDYGTLLSGRRTFRFCP